MKAKELSLTEVLYNDPVIIYLYILNIGKKSLYWKNT